VVSHETPQFFGQNGTFALSSALMGVVGSRRHLVREKKPASFHAGGGFLGGAAYSAIASPAAARSAGRSIPQTISHAAASASVSHSAPGRLPCQSDHDSSQ
jgi:hypothetical protein